MTANSLIAGHQPAGNLVFCFWFLRKNKQKKG